jgi:hypothetical protein
MISLEPVFQPAKLALWIRNRGDAIRCSEEYKQICAVDAAFRAVQLKVAITRWLGLHKKEWLYQEEKITARISGRSHLIKENKAKNYNSLCGGKAARWLPKHLPSPKWRVSGSKVAGLFSPPPPCGDPPK